MSRIMVTLTSRSDSDFECSNTSFSENKLDGVDLNSINLALTNAFQRTEKKLDGFSRLYCRSAVLIADRNQTNKWKKYFNFPSDVSSKGSLTLR